ncbi:MAG: Fe-S cluster assembly protein SufD [Roseovarius sp.]|jgi:Fe-S cluster assembly protein SufD|nr:Fe-S cluster assembly protein SufD [Roseovarius sp.]
MADIKIMKTPAETTIAELFSASKAALPGDASAREAAFARFTKAGLPHRRVEEWKYTDLRAAMREAAPLAPQLSDRAVEKALSGNDFFAEANAAKIAIVNGHVSEGASELGALPDGVNVVTLSQALAENHPLLASLGAIKGAKSNVAYALNAAFMTDGVVLHVSPGVEVSRPIHLRFAVDGESALATATRVLLVVEEGASVTLLESHESADGVGHQPNNVVEIIAGDKSRVRHLRIDRHGREALALSTLTAHLGAHVAFDSLNLVARPGFTRHQVYMTFAGEHTVGGVRGATMLNGSQHADTTLFVDHIAPHCESRELYKTVLDGEAVGVFQGKIAVAQTAQKTDGKMMSSAVMLSEGGTMNNKPELEIFADDVLCAHGATCGALDDDLLFYLMARGLPRKEAEALLVESFLGEPIEEALGDDETLHGAFMAVIQDWLAARS